MSLDTSKPYSAPRPAEYAQIPKPILRKAWRGDSKLPGPNPIFADFITATFMINTPRFLLKMQRKYGDSCSFFLSRRLFVGMFSPAAVHEITVAQQHNFVKGVGFARMRKVLGEGLLTNEEPIHLAHRRMMQPPFHHGNLDSYVAIMHQLVNQHTLAWRDKNSIELAPEMMALTLEIVSRCLFGLDSHQYTEAIAESMGVAIDRIERTMLPGLDRFDKSGIKYFKEFEQASDRLVEIAEAIINKRIESQQKKDDDLLGILLQMQGAISIDHIRDEVLTLILSGHETTANVMSWAFSYLSKNPQVRKELADEADRASWITENRAPTYQELEDSSKVASAILQESMRLAPPVWVAPRIATVDCEVDGVKIPKGAHVLVSQYVTHRNPRFFPEPQKWDPNRWLDPEFEKSLPRGAYFPFGGGSRKCLGEYFALAEARLILLMVAKNFRLDGAFPKAQPRATYRPKGGVKTKVTLR
ncbi:MAG: cytochrome P450 [Candidatus Nanopelagicus sp.]